MWPEKESLVLHTGDGGEGADIHDIQEFSCDQRKEVLSCGRWRGGANIHDIQEFSCDQRKEVLSYTREVAGRGLTYTTYKNFHVTRERSLVFHTEGGGEGADIHDIQKFSCDQRKEVLSYTREVEGRGLTYTIYKNFYVTRERKSCLTHGMWRGGC